MFCNRINQADNWKTLHSSGGKKDTPATTTKKTHRSLGRGHIAMYTNCWVSLDTFIVCMNWNWRQWKSIDSTKNVTDSTIWMSNALIIVFLLCLRQRSTIFFVVDCFGFDPVMCLHIFFLFRLFAIKFFFLCFCCCCWSCHFKSHTFVLTDAILHFKINM